MALRKCAPIFGGQESHAARQKNAKLSSSRVASSCTWCSAREPLLPFALVTAAKFDPKPPWAERREDFSAQGHIRDIKLVSRNRGYWGISRCSGPAPGCIAERDLSFSTSKTTPALLAKGDSSSGAGGSVLEPGPNSCKSCRTLRNNR
jgi:hypothetical protein